MIWFKGLWKNIPLRVTWHFSLHSLTYIYSSKVSSRMACLFSSSNHSKLSKESDQTSGLFGQQLISLGPLKRNYMRLQCSFCPLRFSLALSPSREAEFCNPEILTLSHSPVHMFTAPAGSGMGTLRCQEKGPRLQNYFSSWYKRSQMQCMILSHLPSHEILLASSILLLHRKVILLSKPCSCTVRASWKISFLTALFTHDFPCLVSLHVPHWFQPSYE